MANAAVTRSREELVDAKRNLRKAIATAEDQLFLVNLELAGHHIGRDRFRDMLADETFWASHPKHDWREGAMRLLSWLERHVRDGEPEPKKGTKDDDDLPPSP